jgi:hypothetical protein
MELAQSVRYPGFVGSALASTAGAELDETILALLDNEDRALVSLADGYCVERAEDARTGVDRGWT